MAVAGAHPLRRSHGGSTSALFFQWKNPENEEDNEGRGEIEKMSRETSSNFDRC